MKTKMYDCDGGSLCVGTKDARACFLNNYGDGRHKVTVYRKGEWTWNDRRGLDFKGSVTGKNIQVFDYDCLSDEDIESGEHILFTLSGRVGIYADDGHMYLFQWD